MIEDYLAKGSLPPPKASFLRPSSPYWSYVFRFSSSDKIYTFKKEILIYIIFFNQTNTNYNLWISNKMSKDE